MASGTLIMAMPFVKFLQLEVAGIQEKREILRNKLHTWEQLRAIYMPGVLQYCVDSQLPPPNPDCDKDPEAHPLYLPSSLPSSRRLAICYEGLPAIEEKLREAQLSDMLTTIRHTLRLKTQMVQFKRKNRKGQRSGIKSRALIDRIHGRARRGATKYEVAWKAKLSLAGEGEWQKKFREMEKGDVRGYQDPEKAKRGPGRVGTDEDGLGPTVGGIVDDGEINLMQEDRDRRQGTGTSTMTLSWIWLNTDLKGSEEGEVSKDDEYLRSVWCRSYERVKRTTEEVYRMREAMRATLQFLQWKSNWWTLRAGGRDSDPRAKLELREAARAYAMEQADLQLRLAESFRSLWAVPLSQMPDVPSPLEVDASVNQGENTNGDDEEDNVDDEDETDFEENDLYGEDDSDNEDT